MKRYIRSAVINISEEPDSAKWKLAEEPDIRPEVLRELAHSVNYNKVPYGLLSALAGNPNTPEDILKELASLPDSTLLQMDVAVNPNATPELLRWMFENNQSTGLQSAIAENLNTPTDILRTLSSSHDSYTRAACAANPNTPNREQLHISLLRSPDRYVRKDLAAQSKDYATLSSLARDPAVEVRGQVAANMATPVDVLKVLMNDHDDHVRERLPTHKNITPELLRILAEDPSANVRYRVTWSRKTPRDVMERLAQDEDAAVRESAIDSLGEMNLGM